MTNAGRGNALGGVGRAVSASDWLDAHPTKAYGNARGIRKAFILRAEGAAGIRGANAKMR